MAISLSSLKSTKKQAQERAPIVLMAACSHVPPCRARIDPQTNSELVITTAPMIRQSRKSSVKSSAFGLEECTRS